MVAAKIQNATATIFRSLQAKYLTVSWRLLLSNLVRDFLNYYHECFYLLID